MAALIVCGVNHHGAPVDVRERASMPRQCQSAALQVLNAHPCISEAAIVSTCNRTEIYAVAESASAGIAAVEQFFQRAGEKHGGTVMPNLRLLHDDAALQIFRVASGLDSMVIGEGQILGQIKEAYEVAREAGTAGPVLNKLFALALTCGKRVRTETAMARKAVSVASAAVELARAELGDLTCRKILVLGAGTMATLCAKHLLGKKGRAHVTVVNRSVAGLEQLRSVVPQVQPVLADPCKVSPELLAQADVIFVATSSQSPIISDTTFSCLDKAQLVFDLSVPRNVDPIVAAVPRVRLFTVDDLQEVVCRNLKERAMMAERAEPILCQVLQEFNQWKRSRAAAPAVVSYRQRMDALRRRCVARARKQTFTADELDRISVRLMNQFMHEPVKKLRG